MDGGRAGRVGEPQWQLAWLERGLTVPATDEGERAQLAVEHADATQQDDPVRALAAFEAARSVFERLNDVRSIAVTMGKIADILQQRGETAEALRVLQDEALPAFERLNDVRSIAVTMGKIADILQQRGETAEALRIQLEEVLPVAQALGDVDLIAHVRFSCARMRLARGGLKQGEAQQIYDELAESFALLQQLQRVDGIAFAGSLLGQVLAWAGHREEALPVLEQSAAAFDTLGMTKNAAETRALQASLRDDH